MDRLEQAWDRALDSISIAAIAEAAVTVFVIFLLAWVGFILVDKAMRKFRERLLQRGEAEGTATETIKRVDTLSRLLRQAARILLWAIVILALLSEFGVPIGPLLASAGVLGLAVGFGAQALVRDVIAGFFFILENQVRVGDVAIVNGTGGLVEEMNFRTLVLRDLSGTVHIFPNGTISTLANMTNQWSAYLFEIGVAYKENTDRVVETIKAVADGMQADAVYGVDILEPVEIFGVDKLGDSSVIIKGRLKTKPIQQWFVGREFLRRVKMAFDEKGIEIPFPHRTLYFGEVSPPVDVRMAENKKTDG